MIKFALGCLIALLLRILYIFTLIGINPSPSVLQGFIFLENSHFDRHGFLTWDPSALSPILLISFLIVIFSISEITECSSILNMVLHRTGKKGLFLKQLKLLCKIFLKNLLTLNIVTIVLTMGIFARERTLSGFLNTLLALQMFFMRYGLIIFILLLLNEYYSFHKDVKASIVIISTILVSLIFIDAMIKPNFIMYESNLQMSFWILIGLVTLFVVSVAVIYKLQKRRVEF